MRFLIFSIVCMISGVSTVHAESGPVTSPSAKVKEPAPGSSWVEPGTGIEFVYIPAGCFNMGSKQGTPDAGEDEFPLHKVCFKQGFYLSKFEITQSQYKHVMKTNPSRFWFGGGDKPVESVNWNDAQQFVQTLSQRTNQRFMLPSEAQWEYACRAGGNDTYCGGNSLSDVVAIDADGTVGQKHPNAWGLYDMSGNVWEWTQDCRHNSYLSAPIDGSAWEEANCDVRIHRGGSSSSDTRFLRAASRYGLISDIRVYNVGFRILRAQP